MSFCCSEPRYEPIDVYKEKKNILHNVLYFTKWYNINGKSWLKIGITTTNDNSKFEATKIRTNAEASKFDRKTTRYEIIGCVKTNMAELHEKELLSLCNYYRDDDFKDYYGKRRVEFFRNCKELDDIVDEYLDICRLNIDSEYYYAK